MAITPAVPDDVRAINGSTLDDAQIQPFIDSAVCILTQVEQCIVGKGITDSCVTSASAWLAAHLMARTSIGQTSGVKKSESFENYSVTWAQSQVSNGGVLGTPYGETANAMTGGCLQEVDKRTAGVFYFGGA